MNEIQSIANLLGWKYGAHKRRENLEDIYIHTTKHLYYKKCLHLPVKEDYKKLIELDKEIKRTYAC